jgi:hypothetical protein
MLIKRPYLYILTTVKNNPNLFVKKGSYFINY